MPHIAVVTGCTANHLDWHGTFAEYAAAKQKLLRGQSEGDLAVLNAFDAETAGWSRFVKGKLLKHYSAERIARIPLSTPGEHNRANAAIAAAAASAAGCTEEEIEGGLADFRGLPQRLQFVAEIDGRSFYNDSASTTPESTIAALRTFDKPVWLLAGGRNKGFDFSALASAIARHARGAAFFGSCRDELEKETIASRTGFPCAAYENLSEALAWCFDYSHPGEAIVLSPGCASTDQFRNFRHRGETFVELVEEMSKREE
jgi:UDP-N-acetylmuramoylalanine--D-glutamate ligase